MKAYLYYSSNRIKAINDPGSVKSQLAKLLTETFDKFHNVQPSDIVLGPANISNGADIFFVIDEVITDELNSKIVNIMRCVRSRLLEIIKQDQETEYCYRTMTKIEAGHTPVRTAENKTDTVVNADF